MWKSFDVPLYEEHMVEHLLDQNMSPNTELKIEVKICRSSHSSTFFKAYTYLYTVVVRLYPYANPSSGNFRKRSIYYTYCGDPGRGRGGRFDVRGCGRGRGERGGKGRGLHVRGGRGGGSGTYKNGIVISDVTHYFEDL